MINILTVGSGKSHRTGDFEFQSGKTTGISFVDYGTMAGSGEKKGRPSSH